MPDWAINLLWIFVTWALAVGPLWDAWKKRRFSLADKRTRFRLVAGILTFCVIVANESLTKRAQTAREAASEDARIKEKARTPTYSGEIVTGLSRSLLPPEERLGPQDWCVWLGDRNRVMLSASPKQFLLKYENDESVLSVGIEHRKLWLSTILIDSTGQDIVRIIKSEFQALPEGAFNPLQPDPHTLLVRDRRGNDVLHVRSVNEREMWLTGRFVLPRSHVIEVTPTSVRLPSPWWLSLDGPFVFDLRSRPDASFLTIAPSKGGVLFAPTGIRVLKP
jgi:hypothetical protein